MLDSSYLIWMITLYVNYIPLGMLVELAEKSYSGAAFISCSDADRKLRSQEMNVKRVKVKLHFTQKCSGFLFQNHLFPLTFVISKGDQGWLSSIKACWDLRLNFREHLVPLWSERWADMYNVQNLGENHTFRRGARRILTTPPAETTSAIHKSLLCRRYVALTVIIISEQDINSFINAPVIMRVNIKHLNRP